MVRPSGFQQRRSGRRRHSNAKVLQLFPDDSAPNAKHDYNNGLTRASEAGSNHDGYGDWKERGGRSAVADRSPGGASFFEADGSMQFGPDPASTDPAADANGFLELRPRLQQLATAEAEAAAGSSCSCTTVLISLVSILVVVVFAIFFNWRRFACVKGFLRAIRWDKYDHLDLVCTIHNFTMDYPGTPECCVKIIAGGKEYWTDNATFTTKGGTSMEQSIQLPIPQGYQRIIVELWCESGWRKSKHKMAQRVIDIYEVVVMRRPYGCVAREPFTLVKKTDGSEEAEKFVSGSMVLSLQYESDLNKVSDKKVQLIEDYAGHTMSEPMAEAFGHEIALHLDEKLESALTLVPLLAARLRTDVLYHTKMGFAKRKYADVFLYETSGGKHGPREAWHFAIFHSAEDRQARKVEEAKAFVSLLTVSALVPDPKKDGYLCLQHQPSKNAELVDVYFGIAEDKNASKERGAVMTSAVWTEAMHLLIECVRRQRLDERAEAKKAKHAGVAAEKEKEEDHWGEETHVGQGEA
ncbi:unnamed protein product [Amoebophrya sp. A25]|nr:unnamed protein product [Amoebophrya sp. A25]|eukprot:GSA25T00015138001.1